MSREVLSPPLLNINNRIYRVNYVPQNFSPHNMEENTKVNTTEYVEEDLYDIDDDEEDALLDIEELNNQFKLRMQVPQSCLGGIIGFKGSTKRRIEVETDTDINIPRNKVEVPKSGNNNGIFIKGRTRNSVCAAYRKINLLISSFRKRMSPTHYLRVPLNYGEIKESFHEFKKQILALNYPGIDEGLFQDEINLHLTLTTFVLLDDAERAKTLDNLQQCRQFLEDLKTPFHINVTGLEIMNDDPSCVKVLYACVDAPELQKFGNRVLNFFHKSGFAHHNFDRDTVKLHMTVMNTRYRKKQNAQASPSFDARDILKNFGNYKFGSAKCSEMELCVISSVDDISRKITGTFQF